MQAPVDTSLKLGWDRYNNKPKDTTRAAFSHSLGSQFHEDPQKFYLRKVEGHKEPKSVPLAFGIAFHEGMEVFSEACYLDHLGLEDAAVEAFSKARASLRKHWQDIPDPTIRVNPYEPENPRGRQEMPLPVDEAEEKLISFLWGAFCHIEDFAPIYSAFSAQQRPKGMEVSVGELAKKRGRPHNTIYCYNYDSGRKENMPVAVLAGVPIRGKIDLLTEDEEGNPFILDHKLVSKVVPYYPPYNGKGSWKQYEPSYNPATSLQLNLYALATGIQQVGFQFVLRRPQYVPPSGVLYDEWVDERFYEGDGLPAAFVNDEKDRCVHACVWRPNVPTYSLATIKQQTARQVRRIAEELTVSITLYEHGVEPEIAFPAGDPEKIARKACPYCYFGPEEENLCPTPRATSHASEVAYKQAIQKREDIASQIPEVQNLRSHWEQFKPWKSNQTAVI